LTCRATLKPPLLKLFEFLLASLCLLLIEDDEPIEPRGAGAYARSAAGGAGAPSWWGVDAPRPPPAMDASRAHGQACDILCVCLTLHQPQAWKIVQLALLTLWNVSARAPGVERHVAQQGVAVALMDVAVAPHWPHSLRYLAAGFLASLADTAANAAFTGGVRPLVATYVTLIRTQARPGQLASCCSKAFAAQGKRCLRA
jgi:hypothetical protein